MKFFEQKIRYSDQLNLLVALVTHLGYTDWNMRSTGALAKAVAHPEKDVLQALNSFGAIFRRSSHVSARGAIFWQLHIRHALRWKEAQEEEANDQLPLEPEMVNAILDFIVRAAEHEQRKSLALLATWSGAFVSIIAASIAVAFRS